ADGLVQSEAGRAELANTGADLQNLVDAGGPEIVELHPAHDESRRIATGRSADQRPVIVADQPQKIRAAALAPAQIAGVVDESGEVRVLEVDPDRQNVPAAAALILDDAAGKIGPGSRRFAHVAHSPSARRQVAACTK